MKTDQEVTPGFPGMVAREQELHGDNWEASTNSAKWSKAPLHLSHYTAIGLGNHNSPPQCSCFEDKGIHFSHTQLTNSFQGDKTPDNWRVATTF